MTNAERQRRFKAKQQDLGFVQVNVWVPPGSVVDIQRAAEIMRESPHLTVARLVDPTTGKLVGLKRKASVPSIA
jgi:hypothetical protein